MMTKERYSRLFEDAPPRQNTVVAADYLAYPEDWNVRRYPTHIVLGTQTPDNALREIPSLARLDTAIFIFRFDELHSIVGLQLMGLL